MPGREPSVSLQQLKESLDVLKSVLLIKPEEFISMGIDFFYDWENQTYMGFAAKYGRALAEVARSSPGYRPVGMNPLNWGRSAVAIGQFGWYVWGAYNTFSKVLFEDPKLLFESKEFIDFISGPKLWEAIGTNQQSITKFLSSENFKIQMDGMFQKMMSSGPPSPWAKVTMEMYVNLVEKLVQTPDTFPMLVRTMETSKDSLIKYFSSSKVAHTYLSKTLGVSVKEAKTLSGELVDFGVSITKLVATPKNQEHIESVLGKVTSLLTPREAEATQPLLQRLVQDSTIFPALSEILNNSKEELAKYFKDNTVLPETLSVMLGMSLNDTQKGQVNALMGDFVGVTADIMTKVASTRENQEKMATFLGNMQQYFNSELLGEDKMHLLFKICDQGIEFAKQPEFKQALPVLKQHKDIIVNMMEAYAPAFVNVEKVFDVLTEPKNLMILEKAYQQYKKGFLGKIKAVGTVLKSRDLMRLAISTFCRMLGKKLALSFFVRDCMRQSHANERVDKILAERKPNDKNLMQLLRRSLRSETDSIVKYTGDGCLKGLQIKQDMSNLVIDGFDFTRVEFGKEEEPFSLKGCKITNTNFKGAVIKGKSVELGGATMDAGSLLTLLPSIGKVKTINLGKGFTIEGVSPELREKIKKSNFYKAHKDKITIKEKGVQTGKTFAKQERERNRAREAEAPRQRG